MKWFLELLPCWGGAATVAPAAEGVGSLSASRKQEEVNRVSTTRRRRRSKYNGTVQWKPKLHAILEDNDIINRSTMTLNNHVDVDKLGQHMTMAGIFKKQSVKILRKIAAKVTKPSHGEDYTRIYSHSVTVAAFSPAQIVL